MRFLAINCNPLAHCIAGPLDCGVGGPPVSRRVRRDVQLTPRGAPGDETTPERDRGSHLAACSEQRIRIVCIRRARASERYPRTQAAPRLQHSTDC